MSTTSTLFWALFFILSFMSVMALVLRLLSLGLDSGGLVNNTGKNFRKQLYTLMQLPAAATDYRGHHQTRTPQNPLSCQPMKVIFCNGLFEIIDQWGSGAGPAGQHIGM